MTTVVPTKAPRTKLRMACRALAAILTGILGANPAWSAPPLQWSECRLEHPLGLNSVQAQCSRMSVPENRDDPASPRIELKIARVAALNRRKLASPLFLLAGGPGQSAIAMYVSVAPAFARINRNHDIVLLDQRGTGSSSPMQCIFPQDWSDQANTPAAIRAATTDCLRTLGNRVRFYTTAAAVQDLEEARRALDYERIDLYGASYGTRVAQEYMRGYGAHVEAVVLDGVTDPQRPIGPDTPLDGERALQAIIARCAGNVDCARAYPQLAREWSALKLRFGSTQVPIELSDPSNASRMPLTFNRSVLGAALRLLSYSGTQASMLPLLIHRASQGDLAPLAAQAVMTARQVGDQLAIGMQNTVVCSEDWPLIQTMHLDRGALAKTYQGTDQLDGLKEICSLWPRGPVSATLHAHLRSDVPTLLLSGEADPVTPPDAALRAARGLTRHRHLILPGEGHGQLATACVPRLMADFLDSAQPAEIDATCLKRHRPTPFFIAISGPAP